jgi:PAS domain S-box-containing protein
MSSADRKSLSERLKTILSLGMWAKPRRRKFQEKGWTEFEILRAHNFLRSVLQHSQDMIFVTDVHGYIISFNKGGEQSLGYAHAETIGRLLKEFAQEPESLLKLLQASHVQNSAVSTDFSFLHKKGHPVYFNLSLIDLKNAEGKSIGTVGICHNISRWKKLEEDLIRVDRLAEMGRIAAGVAHELNNPLAVINEAAGWGGVVVRGAKGLEAEDRQELEKVFGDIIEQTDRCRNRTKQVLGFSRDAEPSKKEVNVHELLKETVAFLGPELKYKQIDILYRFDEDPLVFKTDPKKLEQVFVNLLTNAIYAIKEKGEEKGQITLQTSASDLHAEIQISDTGTGMGEEIRARIFDLFFTTKPVDKGTGLGLPICHNIVKKLGGTMTCDSTVGEGTTFTIRIPLL